MIFALTAVSAISPPLSATAPSMKKKPIPRMIIPNPIFIGVVNFFPKLEFQKPANRGANNTMNKGLTD